MRQHLFVIAMSSMGGGASISASRGRPCYLHARAYPRPPTDPISCQAETARRFDCSDDELRATVEWLGRARAA
jgi:hypothetical protein